MGLIERARKALGWGKSAAPPPVEVETDPDRLAQALVDGLTMTGGDGGKGKPEGAARAALVRAYRHCLAHAELRHMIRLSDAEVRGFPGLPHSTPDDPREAYLLATFTAELMPLFSVTTVTVGHPELPTVADRRELAEAVLLDRIQGAVMGLALGRASRGEGQ